MKQRLTILACTLLLMGGSANLPVAASTEAVETPVVIMGAGDIAESGRSTMTNATATGDLIRAASPKFVFTVGDNAYPDGSSTDYATKYDPTWGSFKGITRPTPGNHEYHSVRPNGYLGYFGTAKVTNRADGGVYYAYDLGNGWRGYALNSEISMSSSSAQYRWLAADLVAHANKHFLAYWHQPRFVSSRVHGERTDQTDLWNLLRRHGTDIVMAGHEHHSERFAKMSGSGALDPKGVQEFIVGAGGNQTYALPSRLRANSRFANGFDYAVLKLTLRANSYQWAFIASGRGYDGSNHVNTGKKGLVLDSGTLPTNNTVAARLTTSSIPPVPIATATVPAARTATVPSSILTKRYISNESRAYARTGGLGYDVHDTGLSAGTIHSLPEGAQALVWVGVNKESCPAMTSTFRDFVTANASNAKVLGYFLIDEPENGNCVATIRAHADFIHARAPGQKAFIVLTDYPGTYGMYSPRNTHVDLVGLDPYPCRRGTCNCSEIAAEVHAARAAGIPLASIVPTFQVFGGAGWSAPTAAQLRSILARWAVLVPSPTMEYTYSWSTQGGALTDALATRPDWQRIMATHNAGDRRIASDLLKDPQGHCGDGNASQPDVS